MIKTGTNGALKETRGYISIMNNQKKSKMIFMQEQF